MGNSMRSSSRLREEQFLLEMQTMLETVGLEGDEDKFHHKPLQQVEASTDSLSQGQHAQDGGCRLAISSSTSVAIADICQSKSCGSNLACLAANGVDNSGLASSHPSKCRYGNEITLKSLPSFPFHSDANNCADDEDKIARNSQFLKSEEKATSLMPRTHTDEADNADAPSKVAKITGNKKGKRRLSIKYLSPHIERKAPCFFQSEEQSCAQKDYNGTGFVDILTDSELLAVSQRKVQSVNKADQPGRENLISIKTTHLPKVPSPRPDKKEEHARERLWKVVVEDFQQNPLTGRRCRQVRKGSHKANGIVEIEFNNNLGQGETSHTLHNAGWTGDPIPSLGDHSGLPEDAEAQVAEFLGTGEPLEFTLDPDVPLTGSLTVSDWKKVKQILDNLKMHYLWESHQDESKSFDFSSLANYAEGSGIGTDLSYVEKELRTFVEVSAASRNPTQTLGVFWAAKKQKTVLQEAHGDSVLKTLPSIFHQIHRFKKLNGPRLTQDHLPSLRKVKATDEKYLRAASSIQQNEVSPADNTNVSMSREQEWQYLDSWSHIPALQHQKWKCRSAPELRSLLQKEEPTRRVSDLDLPISHMCDINGPHVINVDSAEDQAAVPSLLWGQEAYRHYKLLTMIETKEKIQLIKSAKAAIIKRYLCKQRALQNIVDVAKAYYSDPTRKNRKEWKRLREEIKQSKTHSITDIRHTLAQIPDYSPIFTVFLMLAQVLSLVVMCSVGKLAPVGVLSEKQVRREIQTFLGAETLHRFIIPNPWIGPPATTLLAAGASFAPCMRRDQHVVEQGRLRKFRKLDNTSFGCCQMRGSLNAAGTTTKDECSKYTNNAGAWSPPHCGKRRPGLNSVAHVIRPCCMDHHGTCQMLSHAHCNFLGGSFHLDKEHCVEVLCLRHVCTIGTGLFLFNPDPNQPWLAKKGTSWQWWRLLLALFYTFGILHCLPLLMLEWLLMRPLESSAGWLRILVTYLLSGVAGQIAASTAQPYIPQVGSTSGVAGMVGEAAVELSLAWTLLDKPRWEVAKLSGFLLLLLLMGLLPFVSLLGSLAGFSCGALCALVFMPYITFDVWTQCRKALLVITGLALLGVLYGVLIYTYVQLQPHSCQACRSLECISFTENMCNQWDLLG